MAHTASSVGADVDMCLVIAWRREALMDAAVRRVDEDKALSISQDCRNKQQSWQSQSSSESTSGSPGSHVTILKAHEEARLKLTMKLVVVGNDGWQLQYSASFKINQHDNRHHM